MPFIHVKSLPFDPPLKMSTVVEGLTRDFARGPGIDLEHVTATWEFLPAGHYVVAGKSQSHRPDASHPVLVDLLSPDFNQALGVPTEGEGQKSLRPANSDFLTMPCTPQLPSTTWVMPKSTPTVISEIASSSVSFCVVIRK